LGAIETHRADRLAEHTQQLAHHAVRGEVWGKAVDYLRQAGLKAMGRSAVHEAIASLERALQIADTRPTTQRPTAAIDLRLDLFLPLLTIAEYGRSLEAAIDATKLAEGLGDRRRLARALADQCLILRVIDRTGDAIAPG